MTIVHLLAGKIWGGAEQYALDLGMAQRALGHTVRFVIFDAEPVRKRMAGVEDVRVLEGDSVETLASALKGADVIHYHEIKHSPLVFKAIEKSREPVKAVLTRHIARRSPLYFAAKKRVQSLHRIIFVSELSRRMWTDGNPYMPQDKCVTIRNTVPELALQPQAGLMASKFGLDPAVPILTFTGRVRRSKGCETIIRALAQIKHLEWNMVFVGAPKPSNYAGRLKAMADKYGIGHRVFFYGFTPDTAAIVAESSVGIAPSIVRECCPLSPIEYMRAGKPVVCTDNGGQREYIRHGVNGILFRPDDDRALARQLAYLLEEPEARQRIGTQARKDYEDGMQYPTLVQKVLEQYR